MNDKRKFQRYDVNVPVKIEILSSAGNAERIDFEGINVAAGGVLIDKGQSLPENSLLKIEVVLHFDELRTPENPEGALIMTVTGRVVRTEVGKTAIRFNEDYEMSESLNFLQ